MIKKIIQSNLFHYTLSEYRVQFWSVLSNKLFTYRNHLCVNKTNICSGTEFHSIDNKYIKGERHGSPVYYVRNPPPPFFKLALPQPHILQDFREILQHFQDFTKFSPFFGDFTGVHGILLKSCKNWGGGY